MYTKNIDERYWTVIKADARPYNTLEGVITFSNGTTLTIDSSNLITESVSWDRQCIDGDELMFGGVYSSEFSLSIITTKDRYAFFDADISLTWKIQIGTEVVDEQEVPVYQTIPIITGTITDAIRNRREVQLTCTDKMTMLDK